MNKLKYLSTKVFLIVSMLVTMLAVVKNEVGYFEFSVVALLILLVDYKSEEENNERKRTHFHN